MTKQLLVEHHYRARTQSSLDAGETAVKASKESELRTLYLENMDGGKLSHSINTCTTKYTFR